MQDMDQQQRVADILADTYSDDEESATGRKPKPGSITPLGVRVDKGQGLLSSSGATTTLAEMDAAISSIRVWQQRREHDVMDLMKRNATAFEAASAAVETDPGMEEEPNGEGSEQEDSDADESEDGPGPEPQRTTLMEPTGPTSAARSLIRPASARPTTNGSSTPSRPALHAEQRPTSSIPSARCLGSKEMELLKASLGLRFAQLPGDAGPAGPAPGGSSRLRPASAGPRFLAEPRPLTPPLGAADSPTRGRLLPPLPSGQQTTMAAAGLSVSRLKEGHVNEELPWQRRSLSRASSSSAAVSRQADGQRTAPPGDNVDMAGASASAHAAFGSASGIEPKELPARPPVATNGIPGTSGSASRQVLNVGAAGSGAAANRGQQLLDELEEELRALDEEDTLGKWCNDFEGVLARMDRLQSGYQVQLASGAPPAQADVERDVQ